MSRSRLVLVLIATVAVSMVLGGVAVAVTAPKTLSACTTKSHGVRVLATKVKCHKGEQKLTWRIHGRDGAIGARGPKGDRGPQGATGPAGAKGARGDAGPPGNIGNVRTVTLSGPALTNPAVGAVSDVSVWCDVDEQVVGGGFTFANQTQRDVVQESNPVIGPTDLQGWHVKLVAMEPLAGNHNVKAYAMCVAT